MNKTITINKTVNKSNKDNPWFTEECKFKKRELWKTFKKLYEKKIWN